MASPGIPATTARSAPCPSQSPQPSRRTNQFRPAALAPDGSVRQVQALRLGAPETRDLAETVACEAPLELRLNGRSHTILMASPCQLEELALGYCLSEGVVDQAEQVEGVRAGQAELPALGLAHWVDIAVSPELARRAKLRRMAPAATSCSLCGLESLKDLPGRLVPVADSGLVVGLDSVFRLLEAMESAQGVFARTGGAHAAALGTPQGEVIGVAEDIGRHNALDKALGIALREQGRRFDPGNCLAVLSGRLSYEMALKVARIGIPVVASVSAPTGLCVRLLERLNVTLIAFCRPPRATVYAHAKRVVCPAPPKP